VTKDLSSTRIKKTQISAAARGDEMEWIILFAVVFFGVAIFSGYQKSKQQEDALRLYRASITALKSDPANANLRQNTLELGRHYSNLMRDKKGNTVFDEVALMNDINAACAAAHQFQASNTAAPSHGDIENRLSKLKNLKDKGLIDDADFEARKKEIMAQL
jgi:hypothetical protein